MIIIIKQFEDLMTFKEMSDIITSTLKAHNLKPEGVDIVFKSYPASPVEKAEDIPEEVVTSGLNTIVFDTNLNRVIVYISLKNDELETVKKEVDTIKTNIVQIKIDNSEITENIKTVSEGVNTLSTKVQENKTNLASVENNLQTLTAKVQELEQKIGTLTPQG